ncbi:MAG: NAD(P)H-hydrate dehydratase [Selenomonadales bacterium]|nr:NAD(P)H-hydrate dehydratase [Selenomonadales bacterium]
MRLVTAAEMRELERVAIEEYGIPSIVLMENAARQTADLIGTRLGSLKDKRILIFAGKGNNGGDGLAVARYMVNRGAAVHVLFCGDPEANKGDALTNRRIIEAMGIGLTAVDGENDIDRIRRMIAVSDCLVDALLGIGFSGQLRDGMRRITELMNASGKYIIAVDVPTGVHADSGKVAVGAVRAHDTITFGVCKLGLVLYPGAVHCGRITIASIGIPEKPASQAGSVQVIDDDCTVDTEAMRLPYTHKGSAGRVVIAGGSTGLTGAAVLASTSALRSGAGLVTVCAPAAVNQILEIKTTEAMTMPLADTQAGTLSIDAVEPLLEQANRADVLVIGPGLGRHEETANLVEEVICRAEVPLVIDADALYAISRRPEGLSEAKALPIITPHPGEMANLLHIGIAEVNACRIEVAREAAQQFNSIVVLKGARTVVAYPDGDVYLNVCGNEGMATGGMGDVLAGAIGALIAQGLSSHEAAVTGVRLHAMAGDIAAQDGKLGLTAGDAADAMRLAIRRRHSNVLPETGKENGDKTFDFLY